MKRTFEQDLDYLLECVAAHADKFPVPEHMNALVERLRLGKGLRLVWPSNLELLSVSHQRDGWHAGVRCDDTWFDETGQSCFGMAAFGKSEDGPQEALDRAVARVDELLAEINAEIPLRKENRLRQEHSADEILALLGL